MSGFWESGFLFGLGTSVLVKQSNTRSSKELTFTMKRKSMGIYSVDQINCVRGMIPRGQQSTR